MWLRHLCGAIRTSPIPTSRSSPSVGSMPSFTAIGSVELSDGNAASLRRQNGNAPPVAVWRTKSFLGGTTLPSPAPATGTAGDLDRNLSAKARLMPLAFTKFARTYTNGAVIGTKRIIMRSHPGATRPGRKAAAGGPRAAVPGGITSRSRVVRRVRASRRTSGMQTTAFGSLRIAIETGSVPGGKNGKNVAQTLADLFQVSWAFLRKRQDTLVLFVA